MGHVDSDTGSLFRRNGSTSKFDIVGTRCATTSSFLPLSHLVPLLLLRLSRPGSMQALDLACTDTCKVEQKWNRKVFMDELGWWMHSWDFVWIHKKRTDRCPLIDAYESKGWKVPTPNHRVPSVTDLLLVLAGIFLLLPLATCRLLLEEGNATLGSGLASALAEVQCPPGAQFEDGQYLLASDARFKRFPRPFLMAIGTQLGTRYSFLAEAIRRWRPFTLGDELGSAVAIDGNLMAASAFSDTKQHGLHAGAVYTYITLDMGRTWTETSKILPRDASKFMYFGHQIGLKGNDLFVTTRTSNYGRDLVGALYVFNTRDEGLSWTESQRIVPVGRNGLLFGESLAVSENFVVVGAPLASHEGRAFMGQVFVFGRRKGGWEQIASLSPPSLKQGTGFGWAVAVEGDLIVVGAIDDSPHGVKSAGSVFIYRTSNGGMTWEHVQQLTAPDMQSFDWFGYSMGLSGQTLMVGFINNQEAKDREGYYVFCLSKEDGMWKLLQRIRPADASRGQGIGRAISLNGMVAALSAPDDGYYSPGAVYIYSSCNSTCDGWWTEGQKLTSPRPSRNQQFGHSVAVDDGSLIVGALADGIPGSYWGAIFAFSQQD